MPVEVYIPKMSDHMERGTILRWLVREGEPVEKGQILLEVETDKAVGEIEAPDSGVLRAVSAGEGDEVPVGQTIAYIQRAGEQIPTAPAPAPDKATEKTGPHHDHPELVEGPVEGPVEGHPDTPQPAVSSTQAPTVTEPEGEVILATPAARRVAKELGVDLRKVKGTGPGGRIREEDVRAHA
jgi:pyruvate/2-oxoglutarate dehydrogenase complex dihydrolipoamide acyltransferase (E2) component